MKLRKRYTIEYIDDPADFEKLESGLHPAPWELFKKEIIEEQEAHEVYTGEESISGKAWQRFILWSLCPHKIYLTNGNRVTHPLCVQMFMEMLDENGEVVYEDFCELPPSAKQRMFSAIEKQATAEKDKALIVADELEKEIEVYKAFITKCHGEREFEKFRREYGRQAL